MKDTEQQRQTLTETQVRSLRDRVFGHPSSDKNWEACKENWLKPVSVKWLIEQAEKRKANHGD